MWVSHGVVSAQVVDGGEGWQEALLRAVGLHGWQGLGLGESHAMLCFVVM